MSEKFVIEYLQKVNKSDGVALDIGANHGLHTDKIANKFSHVYAFEPHPENILILKKNVESPNVTIVEKAISNRTGTGKLFVSSNKGGHSLSVAIAETKRFIFYQFMEQKTN